MNPSTISIRGASQHNLRNLDLDLPHASLIAISGVSGSGKTSLAFDTIYAEARRRYLMTLDRRGQGLVRRLKAPRVRTLEGLAPAVAIGQDRSQNNPRSTVATLAGTYHYLRLLFARLGRPFCLDCGAEVESQRFEEVYEKVAGLPAATKLLVLAPRRLEEGESAVAALEWIEERGYRRLRVDGVIRLLEEVDQAALGEGGFDVVVDRLAVRQDNRRRLKGSLQAAVEAGAGRVVVVAGESGEEMAFSVRPGCPACGAPFHPISPALFSFNSSQGACPACGGLGVSSGPSMDRVFDRGAAAVAAALAPLWQEFGHRELRRKVEKYCREAGMDSEAALHEWPPEMASRLWKGTRRRGGFAGVERWLEQRRGQASGAELTWLEERLGDRVCLECQGTRLRPEALSVRIGEHSIASVCKRSIESAAALFAEMDFTGPGAAIGAALGQPIRLGLLSFESLGLGYLGLGRRTDSISTGELQRLRLGAALGSGMTQVLYVLDEPSVGLHARDVRRLRRALEELRDAGNTVLVVEHEAGIIGAADYVVELGPGAGVRGGRIVAQGSPQKIAAAGTLTGQYLSGALRLGRRERRRTGSGGWLELRGLRGHNLKNIDVSLPLGNLVCITGVSGSGKSTLVNGTLKPLLAARLQGAEGPPLAHDSCAGLENLERVVAVDQKPIGRTSRSNVASYAGLLGPLRRLYAELPQARLRAYKPAHFSFNASEGACAQCSGSGVAASHLGNFEDMESVCPSCSGRRYKAEVLDIRYRGRSIAEVLELSVDAALVDFDAIPELARRLRVLDQVGLGYLRLGQPAGSFSGGEAQRVKLGAELGRARKTHTFYILDEPTTGLHLEDTRYLLGLLQGLVDEGNSVVVVEHQVELIAAADHVIDLGPEGGEAGGRIVAVGSPQEIAGIEASWTGRVLRNHFEKDSGGGAG